MALGAGNCGSSSDFWTKYPYRDRGKKGYGMCAFSGPHDGRSDGNFPRPPPALPSFLPSFFLSFSLSEACRSERASEQATKRQMHLSELDAEETDIKRLKKQNAESVGEYIAVKKEGQTPPPPPPPTQGEPSVAPSTPLIESMTESAPFFPATDSSPSLSLSLSLCRHKICHELRRRFTSPSSPPPHQP